MSIPARFYIFFILFFSSLLVLGGEIVYSNRMGGVGVVLGSSVVVEVDVKGGNYFKDNGVSDRLLLGVDHGAGVFLGGKTEVRLGVEAWDKEGNVLGSGFMVDMSLDYDMLKDSLGGGKDREVYLFGDAYKYKVTLLSVRHNGDASAGVLPEHLYIEAGINVERYYDFGLIASRSLVVGSRALDMDCDGLGRSDELEVYWDYGGMSPPITAEEYELEWTYVNDYGIGAGSYTPAFLLSYNFKQNSTRIRTVEKSYRISLLYDHGYVLYRVRGMGRNMAAPSEVIVGAWSAAEKGIVSGVASKYYNEAAYEGDKNWQYGAGYSEGGKRKVCTC